MLICGKVYSADYVLKNHDFLDLKCLIRGKHLQVQNTEDKKAISKLYKQSCPANRIDPVKGLINNFFVGEYESGNLVLIFDRAKIRLGEIYKELVKIINPEGVRVYNCYDCTGQFIAHRAELKIYKDRVIIKQWQGRDV